MNAFEMELAKYIGKDNLAKIQSEKIGIAGAGGLGSNSAFNLVRSGFKDFVIVDFDQIEYANLNRQFYFYNQVGRIKVEVLKENLLAINPDLQLQIVNMRISQENVREVFKDCSIVIEAFDTVASKKIVVEEFLNSSKFLVAASGLAGWGNSDQIVCRKIRNNSFIVGDFVTDVNHETPPFSPRVNIAAAKQADLVLNFVLEGCEE